MAADGRQHSVYGKTERATKARLRAAQTDVDTGMPVPEARTTVAGFLAEWLAGPVAQLRPSTIESYEGAVRNHLVLHLGRIRLAKLTAAGIDRMIASLGDRLSPTTVRYIVSVLTIALNHALKQGRIARNVALLASPPARKESTLHPLTAAQARAFLASVNGDRYGVLYTLAIHLGLRQGELIGLRWTDVDLDNGSLSIRQAMQRRTGQLAEPKTKKARRTLHLSPDLMAMLRDHRRAQVAETASEYVFSQPNGAPVDPFQLTRSLHASLAAAGLPHQRFHDLRHAAATLMIEAGVEIAVVSKILGHESIATTADTYAAFTKPMSESAAEKMADLLAM